MGAIYIATDGDDTTGNGTKGTPYLTLGKAHSVAVAGDYIWLKAGTYYEQFAPTAVVGASSAPLWYSGYDTVEGDGGVAVFDGQSTRANCINLNSLPGGNIYLHFRNMSFVNATGAGVLASAKSYVHFVNCTFANNGAEGMYISANGVIYRCTSYGNGTTAFRFGSNGFAFYCHGTATGGTVYSSSGQFAAYRCIGRGGGTATWTVFNGNTPLPTAFMQCTIDGRLDDGQSLARGIYAAADSHVCMFNTIAWDCNQVIYGGSALRGRGVSHGSHYYGASTDPFYLTYVAWQSYLTINVGTQDLYKNIYKHGTTVPFVDADANNYRLNAGAIASQQAGVDYYKNASLDLGAAHWAHTDPPDPSIPLPAITRVAGDPTNMVRIAESDGGYVLAVETSGVEALAPLVSDAQVFQLHLAAEAMAEQGWLLEDIADNKSGAGDLYATVLSAEATVDDPQSILP